MEVHIQLGHKNNYVIPNVVCIYTVYIPTYKLPYYIHTSHVKVLYMYTTYPILPFSLLLTQTSQLQLNYGSSLFECWRSPNTTTWSIGRTERRVCFGSTMPRPLPLCGESTETDQTWPTTRWHEHFVTTTNVTFSTKSVEGSPIDSADGWVSSTLPKIRNYLHYI